MSEASSSTPPVDAVARLEAAAARVQGRLSRVKTAGFFSNFTPWFVVVAFPVLIAVRYWQGFSRLEALFLGLGLIALWAVTGAVIGFFRKPSLLDSLSVWDSVDGKKDLFSSAWSFENERRQQKRELAEGEKLHISRAMSAVSEVRKRLPLVIQMPTLGRAFAALGILAIAVITILPTMSVDEGEQLLTEEMQAEAEKQSERLKEIAADLDKMAEKGEIEKSGLEKLRSDVDEAADGLADSEGKTANEMIEGLEARARAAEKLAEKMGTVDNQWASEEMIREMSQHADFADLAVTIKDKNADSASAEADKIADSLAIDELKIETRERVTTALERTMEAANEVDKTKVVGERIGNASRKMADQQAKTAAREFEELAKYFQTVKERDIARKKLEELAGKLRDAGSKISGSKLEKMKQLANGQNSPKGQGAGKGNSPKGLQSIAQVPMPMPNQPMPQMPRQGPNGAPQMQPGAQGAMPAPIPGVGQQLQPGQKGQPSQKGKGEQAKSGMMAPVPGQKGGQKGKGQKGMAAAMNPNGKPGQNGKGGAQPGLMAPVPGAVQGSPQPGSMLGQAGGQSPGGSGQSAQAGNGGLEAGQGTAAMGNQATQAMKAVTDANVAAQINKNGDSTFRAIEGQARAEKATLESQAAMLSTIRAEEQALDGKSLPASRKNQVQRYFTEIRKQFEKADGN